MLDRVERLILMQENNSMKIPKKIQVRILIGTLIASNDKHSITETITQLAFKETMCGFL